MKRPKSHQIDELAQRIFRDAIPQSWVVNEQHEDYGIDYLVQIGKDNGDLTGINFFVQLKGQEAVSKSALDGSITFPLSSKHAKYYVEQVKDLPVFLVVVDVMNKCGWMLFLQRTLRNDLRWRQQKSRTVSIPHGNQIHDTKKFLNEVGDAKQWLRRHFPDFHTPFLQQCVHHLFVDHALPAAEIIDNGMIERMLILWVPQSPNGISVFDAEANAWEHEVNVDMLHIDIYADGRFLISYCDDDGCLVDVRIRNPEEIGEIMQLVESLNETVLQQRATEKMPFFSLVEPLTLLFPLHDRHVLVPPELLIELNPSVGEILNAYYGKNPDSWNYFVQTSYPGWEQWCRKSIKLPSSKETQLPGSETLVFTQSTGVTTYRRWLAFGNHYREHELPVAMNHKSAASTMFLCDYFNQTTTGQKQLARVLQNLQNSAINCTEVIEAQPTRLGQICSTFVSRIQHDRET